MDQEELQRLEDGPALGFDALSADDVAELPEGTPITVRWSGGNGPHDYVLAVGHNGERYAASLDDPSGALRFYNPLSFVGQESYHTQVTRRSA